MPILLQRQTGFLSATPATRQFQCEQFSTAQQGVLQIIVAAQSITANSTAAAIGLALQRELSLLLGKSAPGACSGAITDPLNCLAQNIQRRMLVLACDGAASVENDPAVDELIAKFHAGMPTTAYTLLPVIPFGAPVQAILARLPAAAKIQVSRWNNKPSMNAIDVLQCGGLLEDDQRIFISYKQSDSARIAEQLAIELTKLNFRVFLDRYSVNVGVEFQPRLMQELADKAVVVALESAHLLESTWVQDEIDFARVHRVGVIAINLDDAPAIVSVAEDQRVRVAAADLPTGELSASALALVLERIREEHARSLFKRKWELAQSIRQILSKAAVAGLCFDDNGLLEARDSKGAKHKILAISRPGDLAHYHFLDELRLSSTPGHEGAIVSSIPFREPVRQRRIQWLSQKSNIRYYHEGEIHALVASFQ